MQDWLSHRVRSSPDALALVDADAGRSWTYADLDAAVDETARRLAALGVGAGDHVGVLLETRPAFVRLLFAVQRLGSVLVPLNARLAPPEVDRQVDAADAVVVVCERDTEETALAAAGDVPVASVDTPEREGVAAFREAGGDGGAEDLRRVERSLSDPLAVMFTSGTTGDPKAVELTNGNFLAAACASAFRLGVLPGDRWLCPLSLYHMGGLSIPLRCTLYGTTTVIQSEFDAADALDALHEYDCTGVSLVPTMLRRMLDEDRAFPASLRFALVGGAPTPVDLREEAADAGVPVYPSYGMTETASQIATATPDDAADAPGTVGRPLVGYDVTVVGEDGPLPPGEVGKIHVDGPSVTPGYYGNPDATRDAFGEHGFDTGDVGYVDEAGRLHVLNRRSDRIVTGGENVHPGEVVDVLRRHPDVADAAVVGLDDPEWGERVGALVVASGDLSGDDLRAFCRGRLAGYKLPRAVTVVDALPRTASGTVDRDAARDLLADEGDE